MARGWCSTHYERWRKRGDVGATTAIRLVNQTTAERFARFVVPGADDECWLWVGPLDAYGYGCMGKPHTPRKAHRFAWEQSHGRQIPDGLTIDHTCHNGNCDTPGDGCPHRRCVNPAHLEAVTLAENIRRVGPNWLASWHASRTHCPHGHAYEGDNIKWYQGRRYCRECHRIDARRRRAVKRDAE